MTTFAEIHRPATASDAAPVLLLHGGIVANWMWQPQVDALADRLVLTPDLPGFGSRTHEVLPDMPGVVDELADRLTALGITTPVDVVGLSFGGIVALHLAGRHPRVIRSALVTGAMITPPAITVRMAAKAQVSLWDAPWFWKAQAAAFRLPADARSTFVRHGLSVSRKTAQRMFDAIATGGIPEGLADLTAPLLAVAGEREPRSVRASLRVVRDLVPHAEVRLAPGMHHVWNIEDAELFNQTTRLWLDGQVHPRLLRA